jgi:hypothetical protein
LFISANRFIVYHSHIIYCFSVSLSAVVLFILLIVRLLPLPLPLSLSDSDTFLLAPETPRVIRIEEGGKKGSWQRYDD